MASKTVNAWCLYDWANSAFATTVMAAMFPPFFRSLATRAGLASADATAYWGYTTAIALLIIAVLAPLLGAVSDVTGRRKWYLASFAGLGILACFAFATIGEGDWQLAAGLFIAGNIGFAGSIVFYESLLPHLAAGGEMDRISTRGYAFGYAGGGLLLLVNVVWVMQPGWFGFPDAGFALKVCFISVGVWWGLFSVPLLRRLPEPPAAASARGGSISEGLTRLRGTVRDLRRYRQLFIFLVAYWIYNDGIGTIIKMATAYGDEIGIRLVDMTIALLITQVVGVPCSFAFGALAGRLGAKGAILVALAVYTAISFGSFFMRTALHFYILAFLVGTVQGGSQALSRSLFGAMVPKHKSAEFYGFYSTSAKFAGIVGPVLFGVVSQLIGHSRLSIVSLIVFFVVGGLVLKRVDVAEGIRVARAAEAEVSGGAATGGAATTATLPDQST
ncbi:MAG: MFS transporter [bacterium]